VSDRAHAIDATRAGSTALQVLSDLYPRVPTAELTRALRDRSVVLNERPCGPNQVLQPGDVLTVGEELLTAVEPAPLPGLTILHEEHDFLVCAKPAGVSVEASRQQWSRPLWAALLHHLRETDLRQSQNDADVGLHEGEGPEGLDADPTTEPDHHDGPAQARPERAAEHQRTGAEQPLGDAHAPSGSGIGAPGRRMRRAGTPMPIEWAGRSRASRLLAARME